MLLKLKIFIVNILFSIKYAFIKLNKYNILSEDETIRRIVEEGYSISRYGDGEFKLMLERKMNFFQKNDELLAQKLREVICEKEDSLKLLIGIPRSINDVNEYTSQAQKFWKAFWSKEFNSIRPYLIRKEYCNTNLTRPYMDYKNKNKQLMHDKFEKVKSIWSGRDIVIIEGEKTMLGVGNDLFDNCKSVERIICPAKNAFEKYEQILNEAKKVSKDKMFLISLGPTATILACDLTRSGYQAIDTGHIDIEYMWFQKGCIEKEPIKGKYVNEVKNNDYLTEIKDDKYEKEIIARIL